MWKPIMISACAFPMAATTCAADPADAATEPLKQELRELETGFNKAVLEGDVAFFRHVFADDLTHVSQSGRLRTKAEWLEGRRQGASNYKKYGTDDLKFRYYGETAVVTGIADAEWNEDGETDAGRFQFTRVWVRRDGRWRVAAFQSTAIK